MVCEGGERIIHTGTFIYFFLIKTKKEKIKGDRKPSGLFESMNLFYLFVFCFLKVALKEKKKI